MLRPLPLIATAALALAATPAYAVQHFESRPELSPPGVQITTKPSNTAPGYVFVAPKQGTVRRGPMIFDNAGALVYFRQVPADTTVLDFRKQSYHGKPVVTWWEGEAQRGYGFGKAMILDDHYGKVA